jgi:hypothetical protein
MTSNTPPQKPDWFALIEKDAPSARVRKIDKKLPAITAFLAITIVALGTFFTNGSLSTNSSAASNSAGNSISAGTSVNTVTSTQVAGKVKTVKVDEPQSINKIMDPALNGGGSDEDGEYEDEDEEDEDEDDEEENRD